MITAIVKTNRKTLNTTETLKNMFTTWEYKKEQEEYLEKSDIEEDHRDHTDIYILKSKYLKQQRTP
jgi:hypothetical protein